MADQYSVAMLSQAPKDYVIRYAQFQAVARMLFGNFVSGGLVVPRVSGDFAAKMLAYWYKEAVLLRDKYRKEAMHEVSRGADFTTWMDHVTALDSYARIITPAFRGMGKNWVDEANTVKTWDYVAKVMVGMNAYKQIPSVSFIDIYLGDLAKYGKIALNALETAVTTVANLAGKGLAALLGGLMPAWLVPFAILGGGYLIYRRFAGKAQ